MKVKLSIFNTSKLVVPTKDYYKKIIRKKFPEIAPKRIEIPSFVYLIESGNKKILFNAGTSYKTLFGSSLKGKLLTKYYGAVTTKEIWGSLTDLGIKHIDGVIFSHLHADHFTGALSHKDYDVSIGGFYADKGEIAVAKRLGFRNYFQFPKKDIRKIEINPLPKDFDDIEPLPGHTLGGHIGFWVNKKILLVGDAIETPYSFEDPLYSRLGRKEDSRQTLAKLRNFADQGILLLSNHNFHIHPTNGKDFINSEQHRSLLEHQKNILRQIDLER